MVEVTQLHCPQAPGPEGADNTTHHLVPRAAGLTCAYCGKTEAQIAKEAEATATP